MAMSPCSQSIADRVASCALDHYHNHLTKKAKPKPGQEWTVFAAIVAVHRVDDQMWVVSSATGTKCTAQRHDEFILHDSHAEVLARRGFIRILFDEIKEKKSQKSDEARNDGEKNKRYLLEVNSNKDPKSSKKMNQYKLDSNIEIHLYISDSPCGDASIYGVPSASTGRKADSNSNNEILYTGAKVIVSKATNVDATDCGGDHQLLDTESSSSAKDKEEGTNHAANPISAPVVAREEVQSLGKLRTKSGRSNLPAHMRSHSHSCSDKIVLWSVLGLQGAMLTKYLNPPIVPLTSVVVSIDSRLLSQNEDDQKDPSTEHREQQSALERAIPDRVRKVWEQQKDHLPSWKPQIPTVHIVRKIYESGKAAMIASTLDTKPLSGQKRKHEEPPEDDYAATKPKKIPPCGMSFNWNQNDGLEVLVGSRGIKHGKKPKTPQDIEKLASRLCRATLVKDFLSLEEGDLGSNPLQSLESEYFQIKTDAAKSEWSNLKNRILTQNGSPLAGWLRCIKVEDSGP